MSGRPITMTGPEPYIVPRGGYYEIRLRLPRREQINLGSHSNRAMAEYYAGVFLQTGIRPPPVPYKRGAGRKREAQGKWMPKLTRKRPAVAKPAPVVVQHIDRVEMIRRIARGLL